MNQVQCLYTVTLRSRPWLNSSLSRWDDPHGKPLGKDNPDAITAGSVASDATLSTPTTAQREQGAGLKIVAVKVGSAGHALNHAVHSCRASILAHRSDCSASSRWSSTLKADCNSAKAASYWLGSKANPSSFSPMGRCADVQDHPAWRLTPQYGKGYKNQSSESDPENALPCKAVASILPPRKCSQEQ